MGKKNLTEGALDKVVIAFRCPTELKYKVLAKFGAGRKDDNYTEAFLKCVQAATADVKLTKELLDAILEEEAEAYKERMRKRILRDVKRGKA